MSGQNKKSEFDVPEDVRRRESIEIAAGTQRVLKILRRRCELAQRKSKRNPTDLNTKNYLHAAQEFWAITKVINLATELGKQVVSLQGILEMLVDRDDALKGAEEVFKKMAGEDDKKKPN